MYYLLLLDTCTAPDELINPKKKIFEQIQVIPELFCAVVSCSHWSPNIVHVFVEEDEADG